MQLFVLPYVNQMIHISCKSSFQDVQDNLQNVVASVLHIFFLAVVWVKHCPILTLHMFGC